MLFVSLSADGPYYCYDAPPPLTQVASTENAIIFGNIVYDVTGAGNDRNVVVLNDIHIDIMDYIVPASCSDQEFRQMWAEFEWENKVRGMREGGVIRRNGVLVCVWFGRAVWLCCWIQVLVKEI